MRDYNLVHYRPQRLFHPVVALRVHIVSNEVVVGFTANAFMILTIVPDRVVGTEIIEVWVAVSSG